MIVREYPDGLVYSFFLSRIGKIASLANNTVGTVPGYWSSQPTITTGVYQIATYSPGSKTQDQKINANPLSIIFDSNGVCTVKPSAKLILDAGQQVWGGGETEFWQRGNVEPLPTHIFETAPIRAYSAQSVSGNFVVSTGQPYGDDGQFYKRQIRIRLGYAVAGSGVYSWTGNLVVSVPPLWVDVTHTVSQVLTQGNYDFKFQVIFETIGYMNGPSGYWYGVDSVSFLGGTIELNTGTSLYDGSVQVLAIGR